MLVLLLAAVPVALLAAWLIYRANRVRGQAWVNAHVTVRPRPGRGATFQTLPDGGPDRDHAFAVIPVEVGRSTTVEENLS